jgi:FHS family L-fucose permease-like MFS transporter
MIIEQTKSNNSALYTLLPCFLWEDSLVHQMVFLSPFVKLNLKADQFQSQLIDFAFFYGAYYIAQFYFYIAV